MSLAISAVIPSPSAEVALDMTWETHRRFQHGAFSQPCPTCRIQAGEWCRARRSLCPARRELHRQAQQATALVPLLVGRAR
ncbi:zinc finger domain-containing protein [Streptomyces sp. NPDC001635]